MFEVRHVDPCPVFAQVSWATCC